MTRFFGVSGASVPRHATGEKTHLRSTAVCTGGNEVGSTSQMQLVLKNGIAHAKQVTKQTPQRNQRQQLRQKMHRNEDGLQSIANEPDCNAACRISSTSTRTHPHPPPFPGKQCTCSILLLASLTLCCAELLLRCPSPARICCSRSCTIILDLYGAQSVHVHIYRKLISHSQSRSQTLHYDALVF